MRKPSANERIAEARKRWGFVTCPKCNTMHTTKTVTCRECGYNGRTKEKRT